jgi:hypothetical protein
VIVAPGKRCLWCSETVVCPLLFPFVETANFALRHCAEANRFYERKKAKINNVVVIKPLAHKLARACFHILKERKAFDVTRYFA